MNFLTKYLGYNSYLVRKRMNVGIYRAGAIWAYRSTKSYTILIYKVPEYEIVF